MRFFPIFISNGTSEEICLIVSYSHVARDRVKTLKEKKITKSLPCEF